MPFCVCVCDFFSSGVGCVRQCREHVVGVLKEAVHSLARLMEAKVWFSEARDRVSVGMCLHAFFSLRNEGLIVMNTTFLANLLKISRDISSCSMLSLAPVDMQAPGNTMAEAILAIMDPFASSQRDALWRDMHPPTLPGLPLPPSTPSDPRLRAPKPPLSRSRQTTPAPSRSRQTTPAPSRSRQTTPAPSRGASPVGGELASGHLLSLLLEADFVMVPGTEEFDEEVQKMFLYIPEWIFGVLEAPEIPVMRHGQHIARSVLTDGMMRCLQLYANSMRTIAKAVYFASKAIADAIVHGHDTMQGVMDDIHCAAEQCRGLVPTIRAFCSIHVGEHEDFKGIGVKRSAGASKGQGPPKVPRIDMPSIVSNMPAANAVKQVYARLWQAHDVMWEMQPEDGFETDWDRICDGMARLLTVLRKAKASCGVLLERMHDEGRM